MGNSSKLTPRQQEINDYLIAITRLYGVVEHRQFLKIFNHHHEEKLLKEEVIKYSYKLNRKLNGYYIFTNLIIYEPLYNDEIDYLMISQKGKEYYFPTKDEVEHLIKNEYLIDNDILFSLTDYLVKEQKVNALSLSSIRDSIILDCIRETLPINLVNMATKHNFKFNDAKAVEKYAQTMMLVTNNVRKWANRANTPTELANKRVLQLLN
jgi:hypothetical protein